MSEVLHTSPLSGEIHTEERQAQLRRHWKTQLFCVSVLIICCLFIRWHLALFILIAGVYPISQYRKWQKAHHKIAVRQISDTPNATHGIHWEYDVAKKRYTKVQGETETVLGYDTKEFVDLLDNTSLQAEDIVHQTLAKGKHEQVVALEASSGQTRWFQFTSEKHLQPDGSVILQGFAYDVTELEKSRNDLRQRAEHDSLTQLPNREGLVHFLDIHDIGDQTNKDFAILIIDIDRFKEINDTFGHLVGDKVIAALAARFSQFTSESSCVARLGGDEFAVAMVKETPDSHLENQAQSMATNLLSLSKQPLLIDELELSTSVSIGIALSNKDSWTELLRKADIAMYDAKRRGMGVQRYQEKSSQSASSRLSMQADMVKNLENQIKLYYQPIVDAKSRKIVAAEGLARWNRPGQTHLLPEEFLDLIATAGLTARFDNHVLSLAALTAAKLAAEEIPLSISANLSARSLWSPALRRDLVDLLSANTLAGDNLTIEITEQGLLDDHQRILPTLMQFRAMGIKLALDDYGTGASSLVRLRNLPFNEIKIDRSFVEEITSKTSTDSIIVQSSLDLATKLGLQTVAEGIESTEQADILSQWGCTRLQGYLFGKAVPLEELIALLTAEKE